MKVSELLINFQSSCFINICRIIAMKKILFNLKKIYFIFIICVILCWGSIKMWKKIYKNLFKEIKDGKHTKNYRSRVTESKRYFG